MVNSVKENAAKRRNPSYSKEEMTLLLDLVGKYQTYILARSTNSAVNHTKEIAWIKLAREFNNAHLGIIRSPNTLRLKWENMKRNVRSTSKNSIDTEDSELATINSRILALISESKSTGSTEAPPDITIEEDIDGSEINVNDSDAVKYDESDVPKDEDSDTDDKSKRFRSQNFCPKETKLLLQCAKKEKKNIFIRHNTNIANEIKNKAWSRIADSYNKLSPLKRSTKCLRTKFESMKKLAKKVSTSDVGVRELFKNGKLDHQNHKSYEELIDDSFRNIKKEPSCDENMDDKSDHFSDNDSDYIDFHDTLNEGNKFESVAPDPLSCVLQADSGMGSSSSNWNWSLPENKEIVQLQKELLNYQMETANLERKRVEDAIAEEARSRESRELERSLRVRAARLQAHAAALALPPAHPAHPSLACPPEEARAQQYLASIQYHGP